MGTRTEQELAKLEELLEELVKEYKLSVVINSLAEVCYERGHWLKANGQHHVMWRGWLRAGQKLRAIDLEGVKPDKGGEH